MTFRYGKLVSGFGDNGHCGGDERCVCTVVRNEGRSHSDILGLPGDFLFLRGYENEALEFDYSHRREYSKLCGGFSRNER